MSHTRTVLFCRALVACVHMYTESYCKMDFLQYMKLGENEKDTETERQVRTTS